ncbi:MxaA protein [Methyloligella halotolerans]|uniref:MxaA protein n=1 Tax=Methyloligella halotolerans TaxID=1177755 RepID=A0A1E2RWS2_9HYPH|nr:hypothetical protein [Methyloligella halotolerans]ODA66663.1 MxaA protein [Methyloligella halotolerans]
MRRLHDIALGLMLLVIAGMAAPPIAVHAEEGVSGVVHAIRDSHPRDFGYFPGDTITREIYLAIDDGYHLQDASVPAEGALNYWLDLRQVKVKSDEDGGERRYLITLTYQTFYVPLEVKRRNLPGFTLQFAPTGAEQGGEEDDGSMATAHIPQWSFLMSPLREIQTAEPPEGPVGFLKPDRAPQLLKIKRITILLAISAIAVALFLVLLAHHYAWGPFRQRAARPFTVAARQIGSRKRHADDPEAYRGALLDLHRAFDATAGHRVFAEDAPGFLAEHPGFQSRQAEVGRFYGASRLAFFKSDLEAARSAMPLRDLSSLASQLGAMERRS